MGEAVKFLYQPDNGILARIGIGNTEDAARVEKLKTVFVNPKGAKTLADEFAAKRSIANYWLLEDANGTYTYGRLGKEKKQWDPAVVTLTALSGLVQNSNYAENRGIVTEMKYDADGLVTQIIRNGKVTKELVRDEFKRVIGEKDGLKRFSRQERDIRGNLLAETAPNGSITRYEYDSMGRRTAQIDGNGNKITFAYDLTGNLIKQTNALGNGQTWTYDPKTGKLLERTNGVQSISQTYDPQGQLTAIDYGNSQKLDIGYDEKGRQVSVTSPDAAFASTYDPEGRLIAAQATHGEEEYLLSYRYNRRGQRTGLLIAQMAPAASSTVGTAARAARYEVLQQTDQTYDSTGNLNGIFSNGVPAIRYRHDMSGRPIQKTYGEPNKGHPALTADIAYNSMGHLARMEFKGGALTSPLILSYVWDDADQLSSRTWNGQTLRYEYDPSGQLLKVFDAGSNDLLESYTYDRAGNMLTKSLNGQLTTMTYNAGNQLASSTSAPAPPITYAYDNAGRMLGPIGTAPSEYGWLDKLVTANQAEGPPQIYQYWPDGHIASIRSGDLIVPSSTNPQSSSSQEDSFLWDGLALIKRNDVLYIIEPHPSGGVPIASHPVGHPEEVTYHLNDMLGTTLATVGPDGLRFSKLTSFGQPLKATTTNNSLSADSPSAPADPLPSTNQLPPSKQ